MPLNRLWALGVAAALVAAAPRLAATYVLWTLLFYFILASYHNFTHQYITLDHHVEREPQHEAQPVQVALPLEPPPYEHLPDYQWYSYY